MKWFKSNEANIMDNKACHYTDLESFQVISHPYSLLLLYPFSYYQAILFLVL